VPVRLRRWVQSLDSNIRALLLSDDVAITYLIVLFYINKRKFSLNIQKINFRNTFIKFKTNYLSEMY